VRFDLQYNRSSGFLQRNQSFNFCLMIYIYNIVQIHQYADSWLIFNFFLFSGIGLSLVEQLVANTNSKYHLHICLTCRNWQKGEQVRKKIQCLNPNVDTKLVKMDVESIQSVIEASEKIMTM